MRGLIPLILLFWIPLWGCDRSPSASTGPAGAELRIVTLYPSLTKMVIDLGYGDRLVGRSGYDQLAPADLPVVGDLYDLRIETLLAVRPNLVIVSEGQQGIARLQAMGRRRGWRTVCLRGDTVDQVMDILAGDRPDNLGRLLGCPKRSQALAGRMEQALADIRRRVAGRRRPRVLLLPGMTNLMASSDRTFLGELLTAAGGDNVMAGSVQDYPLLSREQVIALSPEVVFVLTGGVRGGALQNVKLLERLDIPAARARRIHVIDDPTALLPASGMEKTARRFAELLHPDAWQSRTLPAAVESGAP